MGGGWRRRTLFSGATPGPAKAKTEEVPFGHMEAGRVVQNPGAEVMSKGKGEEVSTEEGFVGNEKEAVQRRRSGHIAPPEPRLLQGPK